VIESLASSTEPERGPMAMTMTSHIVNVAIVGAVGIRALQLPCLMPRAKTLAFLRWYCYEIRP